jgi:hypothetical protein
LGTKLDTVLFYGRKYRARSNLYGAISGICENGERIGNTLKVANSSKTIYIIYFDNVTLIEEVYIGDE